MEIQNDHQSIYFKENIQGINEYPYNWPDGEISYRLNSFTNDIAKERLQHRAVTVALRAWQLRINKVRFRRERNPNPSVDFEVSFEPLENFTCPGILTQAYFPGQRNVSGDCEINDEWNWVTSSKYQTIGNPPLVSVLIHEFGYSLGLRHDTMEKESLCIQVLIWEKEKIVYIKWMLQESKKDMVRELCLRES